MKIKYKQKQKSKYFFVVISSEIPFSYHSTKNQYDQNGTNLALCLRKSKSSPSEVFLGNGVLKICSKFTGEHPLRSKQLYGNRTST